MKIVRENIKLNEKVTYDHLKDYDYIVDKILEEISHDINYSRENLLNILEKNELYIVGNLNKIINFKTISGKLSVLKDKNIKILLFPIKRKKYTICGQYTYINKTNTSYIQIGIDINSLKKQLDIDYIDNYIINNFKIIKYFNESLIITKTTRKTLKHELWHCVDDWETNHIYYQTEEDKEFDKKYIKYNLFTKLKLKFSEFFGTNFYKKFKDNSHASYLNLSYEVDANVASAFDKIDIKSFISFDELMKKFKESYGSDWDILNIETQHKIINNIKEIWQDALKQPQTQIEIIK